MGSSPRQDAIAIVGIAGRFPGATSLDDFWRVIRDGVEVLEPVSDDDLDRAGVDPSLRSNPRYVRAGTFLAGADLFDANFFGLSPREAQVVDPQQRVFLECAWEALEQAGYATGSPDLSVGVYAGSGMATYLGQVIANPAFTAAVGGYQLMIGNDKDFLATRVSYKLNLRGPSMSVQTACSTSLVSVVTACRALSRGDCDLAIAGGVSIFFPQRTGYLYEDGMIFSPDGHCRPFDAQAQGTRAGAGAAVVVLKRLDDAIADRDTIHAVILGAAINNDGSGKAGYTAPSIEGQIEVIATAQALAGVDPRTISYVEAHGTATPLGDPIEIAALTQVFRSTTSDTEFCRLGSLKANIGHLDAAAGAAGLIKTVLALKHRHLPPLVNFQRPNPQLGLDRGPFAISAAGADWPGGASPRRAGVSSFGIGGTNAHVVLEEAPAATAAPAARDRHLLVLSAKTPDAVDRAAANLAAYLSANPEVALADVEWTLQVGRQAFSHRRALVVRDTAQAVTVLGQTAPTPQLSGQAEAGTRLVAFLFSGQGSQHHAMGGGLYNSEPTYRAAFDRCAEFLQPLVGRDIRELLFAGEASTDIHQTHLTQPLLFATEYAVAMLWRSWGITPGAMLGHSVGEYVAAHLAGVMSLEDALAIVAERGRLMQALPPGNMAAVPLAPRDLSRWLTGGVELAAINAPTLCTIAGPAEAITDVVARLTEAGVDARVLHTSHAFHSSMMEPALAPFTALLQSITLSPPTVPYVSNLTGTWITSAQATSPEYYARHLREAVRFEAGVRTLAGDPTLLLLEVGPGTALTSLARLTVGTAGQRRVIASLPHPREQRSDVEAMLEAAGRLWLAGATLDWRGFHGDTARRRVPLPTYPFDRKPFFVEPDLGAVAAAAQAVDHRRVSQFDPEWQYVPTWMSHDAWTMPARLHGVWLVVGAPGAFRDAVVRHAEAAGATVSAIDPDASESADAFRTLNYHGVIYVASHPLATPSGWTAANACYHGVVSVAAYAARHTPVRIIIATSGAASVLSEPVRHPEAALAVGPVLVIPTEQSGIQLRTVDLDSALDADQQAQQLVGEAASGDSEPVMAHRAGRRWVRRYDRTPLPPADLAALPFKPGGVYLITGGVGGIGLATAAWLARHTAARVVLTSRNPRPEPDALHAIEAAGGEVMVLTADACDEAAMRAAIGAARARWGRIDGVIHAAGSAGVEKPAIEKTVEETAAVFSGKVEGLHVLVSVLAEESLDFVVLLSSVNAITGGIGYADYAAANAYLDAFAESDRYPSGWRQVLSINYPAWRDVGMAARLTEQADRRRARDAYEMSSLSVDMALDGFSRALASRKKRVAISRADVVRYLLHVRVQIATGLLDAQRLAASFTDVEQRSAVSPSEVPGGEVERRLT
ncbi:MAG: type I polyketide synthase, partial [Vicinamibacterales bacterium]